MIFHLIWLMFLREKRDSFITRTSYVTRLVTSLLNLSFYWFCSKAFVPQGGVLGFSGSGLFEFVVLGEIMMAIPLDLSLSFVGQLKKSLMDGTFELFELSRLGLPRTLLINGLSQVKMSLFLMFFNLLAARFLFGLELSLVGIVSVFVLILVVCPLFISLGLASAAVFLFLQRGSNFIGSVVGFVSLSSGVYFPISVFPDFLVSFIKTFSPFYYVLNSGRALLSGETTLGDIPFTHFAGYLVVGVMTSLLFYFVFCRVLAFNRQRAVPIVIYS